MEGGLHGPIQSGVSQGDYLEVAALLAADGKKHQNW